MSRFAEYIEDHREEIMRRFVLDDRRNAAAEGLSDEAVADSLTELLDELVANLRQPGVIARSASAIAHGKQRLDLGYDLPSVVREYAMFQEILFELGARDDAMSREEAVVVAKFLILVAGDSASEYGAARDEAVRELARKHLAFLAHELRNSLNSALLGLSIVRSRGGLESSRAAESIDRGLARMAAQIEEAIVSVRLHGSGALAYEVFDVVELLEELTTDSAADAESKGQRVTIEGAAQVRADRRVLGSALSNLLRNAIKFTPASGAVHLRVKRFEAHVSIEVEDSCGGLPEGAVKKLFDPFVQLGADRTGFGLGLAIAEQAAEAHGGALRVHDLAGKGCVFVLTIPAIPPERPSSARKD